MPTGSFATLDIRVPNETENANTTKLAVQVPPGFLDISTEYMPGWTAKVLSSKLAKPVKTDDGTVTEQVKEIVWTGDGKQGMIPPGQFLNFPISTEIPGKEGQELTFKALQYYDNGEVVRWIGARAPKRRRRRSTSPRPAACSRTWPAARRRRRPPGDVLRRQPDRRRLQRQRQQGAGDRRADRRRPRPIRRRRGAAPHSPAHLTS